MGPNLDSYPRPDLIPANQVLPISAIILLPGTSECRRRAVVHQIWRLWHYYHLMKGHGASFFFHFRPTASCEERLHLTFSSTTVLRVGVGGCVGACRLSYSQNLRRIEDGNGLIREQRKTCREKILKNHVLKNHPYILKFLWREWTVQPLTLIILI